MISCVVCLRPIFKMPEIEGGDTFTGEKCQQMTFILHTISRNKFFRDIVSYHYPMIIYLEFPVMTLIVPFF